MQSVQEVTFAQSLLLKTVAEEEESKRRRADDKMTALD